MPNTTERGVPTHDLENDELQGMAGELVDRKESFHEYAENAQIKFEKALGMKLSVDDTIEVITSEGKSKGKARIMGFYGSSRVLNNSSRSQPYYVNLEVLTGENSDISYTIYLDEINSYTIRRVNKI